LITTRSKPSWFNLAWILLLIFRILRQWNNPIAGLDVFSTRALLVLISLLLAIAYFLWAWSRTYSLDISETSVKKCRWLKTEELSRSEIKEIRRSWSNQYTYLLVGEATAVEVPLADALDRFNCIEKIESWKSPTIDTIDNAIQGHRVFILMGAISFSVLFVSMYLSSKPPPGIPTMMLGALVLLLLYISVSHRHYTVSSSGIIKYKSLIKKGIIPFDSITSVQIEQFEPDPSWENCVIRSGDEEFSIGGERYYIPMRNYILSRVPESIVTRTFHTMAEMQKEADAST
jgi:hypothetical protein